MTQPGDSGPPLEDRVKTVLRRNLPQITMHGGEASVLEVDHDRGVAHVRLTGTCSGCGISPMTIRAIETRLPAEIPEIDRVVAETGTPEEDSAGDHRDHGMGGHPAGGGVSLDYEGEIPEWRKGKSADTRKK